MIIRIFPRRTNATPRDPLAYSLIHRNGRILNWDQCLPGMFLKKVKEIHISTTFTYDIELAELLAKHWSHVGPVKIGGPAMEEPGREFIPGRYIKKGYVITSRGCPNSCWFCSVWRREGRKIRELPIVAGNNILDDNLLACSESHIRAVFAMLKRQKHGRPMFTGGLEAARLKDWHVDLLRDLRPKEMFFAYDTKDDLEPLIEAGKRLLAAGFKIASQSLRCYVLIGYTGDTFDAAEKRLMQAIDAGFLPMAMLYRDKDGKRDPEWARFQCFWARPATVNLKMRVANR